MEWEALIPYMVIVVPTVVGGFVGIIFQGVLGMVAGLILGGAFGVVALILASKADLLPLG